MLRKLSIAAVLAALVGSAAATAATGSPRRPSQEPASPATLMPGVTYSREVDFTSRGPIVLDVVTAPRPVGAVYSLAPALSNDVLRGTEKLTRLQARVAAGATTVAIGGDYFDRRTGLPNGILVQGGVLESQPAVGRSSLGVAADGTLTIAKVSLVGTWQGSGQRRPLVLNTGPGKGKFTLYTPAYGTATPSESGGAVEAVIASLPPARPGATLAGTVTAVANGGSIRIPSGGAVLVARGTQSAAQLRAEAPVGQQIEAVVSLSAGWGGLTSAIGGGPLLVKDGKPVFHANESFDARRLNGRQSRAAIGQLADGRIVLVAVEGTSPAYSIGMSTYELAVELSRLGATTAFGLGSGAAAGLAFDGKLLTRPSTRSEPKLSDALVYSYSGVYAVPPPTPVLSPNGDGVGDTEALSYRLARPSNVVATLVGPGGYTLRLVDAAQAPGLHTVDWDGNATSSLAPEGAWTFAVTATDDRGVTTTAERSFSLDDTLSSLAVRLGRGGLPTATFELTRPATVTVRIERPNGVPVATLRRESLAAGEQRVRWRGRIGRRKAPRGRYQVAVEAKSTVGTSSLAALFSFRPHVAH